MTTLINDVSACLQTKSLMLRGNVGILTQWRLRTTPLQRNYAYRDNASQHAGTTPATFSTGAVAARQLPLQGNVDWRAVFKCGLQWRAKEVHAS